jgi:DNA-binding CsgD family transcriptional regulator
MPIHKTRPALSRHANAGGGRADAELDVCARPSGLHGFTVDLQDRRHVGLINLDSTGTIVDLNDRAREILGREGGLRVTGGCLRARQPEDVEALDALLKSVLSSAGTGRCSGSVAVGRWPDPRPLTVCVNRVDGGRADVAAVVVVLDPWCAIQLSPEQVAKSLRLTPAESCVAVALAEGSTTGEIAEATGKAVPTVRWLVQRALEKTFCSRQADLVRLVLLSSHLPVAQWE